MAQTSTVNLIGKDPVTPGWKNFHAIQRLVSFFIKDPRDIDLFTCMVKLSILLPISAGVVWYFEEYRLYLGICHIALFLFYLGPYVLMLHNVSHRPPFHYKLRFLNFWPQALLGIFFGMTPYTYFSHHLGMHHPENNLETDLSSTMRYRRDSFWGFLKYYIIFLVGGVFTLGAYFIRHKRWSLFRKAVLGELFWFTVVGLLLYLNPSHFPREVTLFVLVIPLLLSRFLLMAGNWTQHAFVDLSEPANPYLNSITFIDSPYNKRCFNDGYHIGHHVNMNRHWLDMPADFLDNLHTYRDTRSIVFRKLDYFMIWFLLMTKQYKLLSRFFVDLSEKKLSQDEIIALIKSRMEPLT
ncbi:MAG TPA: fatty acid desaturase [Turneriella sp.]|nr:fatty acid desaturase [Turneriella sp.]